MKKRIMKPPFFEFGPKTFIWGERAVALAQLMDKLSVKYGVDAIFTAQYTDLERIRRTTENLHVFAQHMDIITPGTGIGTVLPEALAECGVSGVMLNHEERQLSLSALSGSIQRADDVGLVSLVCVGNLSEAMAAACLGPDIVLVENPALIGGRARNPAELAEIKGINEKIASVNPEALVMHAAGIRTPEDVYNVILAGASGTGSTSAIAKADRPEYVMEAMISMVREAWDAKAGKETTNGIQ